jgi:thiamine biosynthesis protein ThiI
MPAALRAMQCVVLLPRPDPLPLQGSEETSMSENCMALVSRLTGCGRCRTIADTGTFHWQLPLSGTRPQQRMQHAPRQYVVIHYGEVSLKGRNRSSFIRKLARNISQAVRDLGDNTVELQSGRLLLVLPASASPVEITDRLRRVFGIANFALCLTVPHDLEAIKRAVDKVLDPRRFASFRVSARRAFKDLPFGSQELNRDIGTHVLRTHDTRVDLDHPELTIHIELIPRQTLIYLDKLPGPGGLPVGASGRLMSLLSGGLDSPVASYRMMKRGCQVDFVHCHSYPFLDRTSQEKAVRLADILTRYQSASRLFLVPFGDLQQHIVGTAPPPYRVVLYRRCMLRIAAALARQTRAQALVTGESLGQVASQTLQNLRVIEAASPMPVLRPLIGMDKAEIIREAQAIETYDTSILPDQDCCTLFVPRHPATRAALEPIEAAEARLDLPALVDLAVSGTQTREFAFPPVETPQAKHFSTWHPVSSSQ